MDISEKIVKINFLRKQIDESVGLSNNDTYDRLWQKFRLEWNYNSNHIEGNTLTYGETELLLRFDKTLGDHDKREYDEMQAHDLAIHLIRDWANDKTRDITEADIRELNKTILVKPFWKEAQTYDGQKTRRKINIGEYKEHPNSVKLSNGEMFHYASPQETPRLMHELIKWYRTNDLQHPIIIAAELHYRFVRIHPFDDGNGRIARLLANYVLMKNGYPPIIIKSRDKNRYITALNKADVGEISAFYEYMADQLIWSLELKIKAINGDNIEELDDIDKEIELLNKKLKNQKPKTFPRSTETVANVIENLLFPLFELSETKLAPLKQHFYEFERKIYYKKVDSSNSFSLGTKESDFSTLIKNFVNTRIKGNGELISEIDYNYRLIGFTQSINGDSLWYGIKCTFNEFNFTLIIYQEEKRFPYGTPFTNQLIQELVNPGIQKVLDRLRNIIEND